MPEDARLLDIEQIGKIRFDAEPDHTFDRIQRVVSYRNLLCDADSHLAQPLHKQRDVRMLVRTGNTAGDQRPVGFLRFRRANGSSGWPLTVRFQRDRMRVSWKKTPCGSSGWMSPFGSEMQKDESSTNVIVPVPGGRPPYRHSIQPFPAPRTDWHHTASEPVLGQAATTAVVLFERCAGGSRLSEQGL